MGSSPGFGPTPCDSTPSSDSLSLRLRVYFPLTSPQRVTRWLILQKARGQANPSPAGEGQRPPTVCKHTVSGSFHSGHPGSFHLSLTVLVHYRSLRIFSLGDWTPLLPTGLACPVVLKLSTEVRHLSSTGLSPSLAGLPSALPLNDDFVTPWPDVADLPILSTPSSQRLHAFMSRVWTLSLSLATTREILSFPEGT